MRKNVGKQHSGLNTNQTQERQFTTNEVAAIAKVSLRQLQWWDERRVVQPHHSGHRRVYELGETVEICVIADLRKKGVSLQSIRRSLATLHRLGQDSAQFLVLSGRNVRLLTSPADVVAWLVKAYDAATVVSIADQRARVDAHLGIGMRMAG